MTLKVTIWNEYRHEKTHEEVRNVYPDGLHAPIAEHLRSEGMTVHTATLDEPEHGLTHSVLADTDVLTWWGHMANEQSEESPLKGIKGKVVAPNEEPVEGALVEVFNDDGSTRTPTSQKQQRVAACRVGEKGKFCFNGLKPGKYILAIGHQGFNITFFSVTLNPSHKKSSNKSLIVELQLGT